MTSPAEVTVASTEAVTDGAVAVDAADGGEAASRLDDGDRAEGHLAAVGGADAHVLEVAERAPLVARVADHDADVVTAALDALGLFAVEGLPHLPAEVLEGEAEGLGGGLDAEPHLLLAGPEGVGHLVDAGVLAEPPLHLFGGRPQAVEVGAGELHVDVAAPAPSGQREVHLHGLRDGPGRVAPQESELLAAVDALLRGRELDRDLAYVRRRHADDRRYGPAAPRGQGLVADHRQHVHEVVPAGLLEQAAAETCRPGLELRDRLAGGRDRRPLRQRHRGRYDVGLQGGNEAEAGPSRRHEADGHDHDADADRGGQVAPAERGVEHGAVDALHEALQAVREPGLEAAPRPPAGAPRDVREVRRQDVQRLEQREQQARDDDERNDPQHLAHHAGHEQQRAEGGHRRQDREGDRPGDLAGASMAPRRPLPCSSWCR